MTIRLPVLALLACLAISAHAGCAGSRGGRRHDDRGAEVEFKRDINAKVGGKIEFGPCGRPKSVLNADVKDCGKTRVNGNAFQMLETAGRLAEVLKIVGNRFKPEVCCPPRPASNVDTSGESILEGQRTRRSGTPSYTPRRTCSYPGRRVNTDDSSNGVNNGENNNGYDGNNVGTVSEETYELNSQDKGGCGRAGGRAVDNNGDNNGGNNGGQGGKRRRTRRRRRGGYNSGSGRRGGSGGCSGSGGRGGQRGHGNNYGSDQGNNYGSDSGSNYGSDYGSNSGSGCTCNHGGRGGRRGQGHSGGQGYSGGQGHSGNYDSSSSEESDESGSSSGSNESGNKGGCEGGNYDDNNDGDETLADYYNIGAEDDGNNDESTSTSGEHTDDCGCHQGGSSEEEDDDEDDDDSGDDDSGSGSDESGSSDNGSTRGGCQSGSDEDVSNSEDEGIYPRPKSGKKHCKKSHLIPYDPLYEPVGAPGNLGFDSLRSLAVPTQSCPHAGGILHGKAKSCNCQLNQVYGGNKPHHNPLRHAHGVKGQRLNGPRHAKKRGGSCGCGKY